MSDSIRVCYTHKRDKPGAGCLKAGWLNLGLTQNSNEIF